MQGTATPSPNHTPLSAPPDKVRRKPGPPPGTPRKQAKAAAPKPRPAPPAPRPSRLERLQVAIGRAVRTLERARSTVESWHAHALATKEPAALAKRLETLHGGIDMRKAFLAAGGALEALVAAGYQPPEITGAALRAGDEVAMRAAAGRKLVAMGVASEEDVAHLRIEDVTQGPGAKAHVYLRLVAVGSGRSFYPVRASSVTLRRADAA